MSLKLLDLINYANFYTFFYSFIMIRNFTSKYCLKEKNLNRNIWKRDYPILPYFIILVKIRQFKLENYFNNYTNIYEYFKIIDIKFIYSIKFNLIKLQYKIGFFGKDKKLISPSDLIFYKNIYAVCRINIINDKIDIYSLPNIDENKYYECIDFYQINEKLSIEFQIYKKKEENIKDNFKIFLPKLHFQRYLDFSVNKDEIFSPLTLNKEYVHKMNIIIKKKDLLKKSYFKFPICILKRYLMINPNIWYFKNIYGNHFSFCKGSDCLKVKNYQRAKYFFFLNVVDKNKNIYPKNHYLFVDFIFSDYSSDDVYPIFSQMEKRKFFVHYLTENIDIYNKYCFEEEKCLKIILVNRKNYTINGDFLQKYFGLILSLKAVISGGGVNFDYINNIFYNIDYIIYICAGHGVSFLKYFLYEENSCYGKKRYNKILIPPSKIFLKVVKKYGWNDENIIKMNLPRWDRYNNNFYISKNTNNKSIFIMFTWRLIKKNKSISKLYFKNILNLINNKDLNYTLK